MPCAKKSLILAVLFKCSGQSPGLILFCNFYIIHMYSQVTVVPVNQSACTIQPYKLYSLVVKVECSSLCCTWIVLVQVFSKEVKFVNIFWLQINSVIMCWTYHKISDWSRAFNQYTKAEEVDKITQHFIYHLEFIVCLKCPSPYLISSPISWDPKS